MSPSINDHTLLLTGYSAAWLIKQLKFSPSAKNLPDHDDTTGEVYTAPQLWRVLANRVFAQMTSQSIESEAMCTHAAHTADEYEIEPDDLPIVADPDPVAVTVDESLTVDQPKPARKVWRPSVVMFGGKRDVFGFATSMKNNVLIAGQPYARDDQKQAYFERNRLEYAAAGD
jgi:hypothetical protein